MVVAGTKVGTGYVSIEPDWTGFQPAVERGVKSRFQKIGDDAGRTLTDSVSKRVRRDRSDFGLAASLAPIVNRFKKTGDEAGRAFSKGISRGTPAELNSIAKAMQKAGVSFEKSAGTSAKAMRSLERDTFGVGRAAKRAGVDLLAQRSALGVVAQETHSTDRTTRSLTGRLRSMGAELRASRRAASAAGGGFRGFDGTMARVNRSAQYFRNIFRLIKWPVLVASVGLFAQGLSALAAGFIAATSAVGPLTGALVALPSLALAAAQAFSVLKLATAGVGGAVKAALAAEVKGGTQAVDTLRQQEAAAERVADAKRNLTDVQRSAKIAQEDLTDARKSATRELEDMRLASEASHDAEQQGNLSLLQARKELAKTLRDPAASGLDVRFAEEAVDQARNDLEQTRVDAKRAREDYTKAKKAGVDGMPEVVSAKRAEEDANRSVADAQRDLAKAVRDNSDAMKDQGSAATALQQKLSQLPKAGQKFVHFLVGLKPRLDVLRETAADGFFPGAEKGIRGALKNFGVFRGLVDGTSKSLGRLAAKAGHKLGSEVWGKDLGRIGKLNERIIGRLGDSTLNLADAFRNVLVSAEPFLDWLGKGTEKFSEWLSTESAAGRESGKLAAFFDRTRETMERVWPILKGVGGALLNIGEAARPLGNEILDALGGAAEGWRKWTDSTKGKNVLKQHFTETKPAIFEMGRLIRDASKAFFELGKQNGVAELLRLVRTELVPALRDLFGGTTGWAAKFLREFGALRKEGVPTFDAFVQTLADHAGQASIRIAKALVNGFLHAGILGKLFIGGWLLARFGGLKALASLGADMGAALGKRLFKAAAKWIAGTEAGAGLIGWFQAATAPGGRLGKAAGVGGTRVGTIFGRGLALGAAASLAAAAPFIVEAVRDQIKKPLEDLKEQIFGHDIGSAINDATDFIGKNAPVAGAAGFVLKGIFGDKGPLEVPAPKTDKALGVLRDFRKRGGEEIAGFRHKLDTELGLVPGAAERSGRGLLKQYLPRLDALKTQGGQKGDAFATRLGSSFASLTNTATTAMEKLGFNVKEMLRALGGKAPQFNLKKALGSLPELKPMGDQLTPVGRQRGGFVPAFATGGLASVVPGHGSGDRHTLSLNGRPVAKVESKEGIFVGNRNYMAAVAQGNAEHPRFPGHQTGGLVKGALQHLRRGGLVEPKLAGADGSLRDLGQSAIKKVYDGAKDYLAKRKPSFGAGQLMSGSGPVESVFADVARKLSRSKTATLALGEAGFAESGMRDLGYGDSTSEGALQLLSSTAASTGIDPHDEAAVSSAFLQTGYTGRGGANKLAAQGLPAHLVAQGVQGSAFSDGSNYLAQEGPAKQWMKRFRLQAGGFVKGATKRLAAGGMVDVPGDGGTGVVNPSIVDLVAAYCKKFDTDVNYGYDPSGHVSPGHLVTGTATDVSPTDGNWDGAFAKGLETLAKLGFEVGYDGSIPGTENWPNHGRGNHAHIEWVGNGTAGDARQRLREYIGGVGSTGSATAGGPAAAPKENVPDSYKGVKAGAQMNFGPMPKNLEAVNEEISRLQGQPAKYRAAKRDAEKNGKPAVAEAIGRNLSAIEARLSGLSRQRSQLRLANVKKALKKRLGGALNKFAGYEQIIEGAEGTYNRASQDAEQVVALEPLQPELPASATDAQREAAEKTYVANFTNYVDTQERPAYTRVLAAVADWRNTILQAERFGFGKDQPSVEAVSGRWEGELFNTRSRISQIRDFSKEVTKNLTKWKNKHPKDAVPDWLQGQIDYKARLLGQLPVLQLRNTKLSESLGSAREMFFSHGDVQPPRLPLPGSGSLEEALRNVQGIHWPDQHELLPASALAPPPIAGRFGGAIWSVQEAIEGLGLKISQATNSLGGPSGGDSSETDSERASLAEELARQANTRNLVSEIGLKVFRDFEKTYSLRDLPKFHTGGVVPGPPNREIIAKLRGEEVVLTPEQMQAAGTASGVSEVPRVVVNGDIVQASGDTRDPVEVLLGDRRLDAKIEGVVRNQTTRLR